MQLDEQREHPRRLLGLVNAVLPEHLLTYLSPEERDRLDVVLLANLRREHGRLAELLDEINRRNGYERLVYKFYAGSVKVFNWQEETLRIVEALAGIAPEGRPFCEAFQQVIAAGKRLEFALEVNQDWVRRAGPIVQAFMHARFCLEMAVKYGAPGVSIPALMPSGLAALRELYCLW